MKYQSQCALAIKTHALGDLLMVTPALHRLKQAIGPRRLVVLTTTKCAPLLYENPDIDLVFELPGIQPSLSLIKKATTLLSLRCREAFVFQKSSAAVALARFAHPRYLAHLTSSKESTTNATTSSWPPPLQEYTPNAYQRLVASVFPSSLPVENRPRLFLSEKELNASKEFLKGFGIFDEFVAIAPGGGANQRQNVTEKRWPADKFSALIQLISRNTALRIVLIGGMDDLACATEVAAGSGIILTNLVGKTDLRMLAAIVHHAAAVVTNDSLPLHLAVSQKTPVVGIFGPSSSNNFLPPGPGAYKDVSSHAPCSPCYGNGLFPGCLLGNAVCMDSITDERVFKELETLILC